MFTAEQRSEIRNVIRSYIDSLTVTWIPVTYINSWEDYSSLLTSEYYKDILGNVHIRIGCKNGSAVGVTTMPEGYRPEKQGLYPIRSAPVGASVTAIPYINFKIDGTVLFGGDYTNSYCIRGEIIYKAA